MGDSVELSVQSDMRKVLADLEALQKKAAGVGQQIQRVTTELDRNLGKNAKSTEAHFERLRDLGRRLADQLRGYFANMATQTSQALEQVKKNIGLKQQFMDATGSAIELHDVIRKIGGSLEIATDRLSGFQRNITKAFTEAGFGAEVAGRALQGIAGTQVSGEGNAQAYALTAAKLAQAGGQGGQEGEIAKAMAGVLQTRGIDQNDIGAMAQLANSVRGRNPLDKLAGQQAMYGAMEPSQRGKFGPDAMRSFAAIRKEVGPEMDAFISKMTQGWLDKLPQTAQGLGKIVNKNGIDFDALNKAAPMLKRLGDDTNNSGATLGLSPDEARGLYAMWKHSARARAAQDRARTSDSTIDGQVMERRGLGENFDANKARIGGKIQNGLSPIIGKVSGALGEASKTDAGAAMVMGGGFLAASVGALATGALAKMLGGGAGGALGSATASIAKAGALEQITGQKTIPVYVVNASEFGGPLGAGVTGAAGGLPGVAGKVLGAAEKISLVGTALAVGGAVGTAASELIDTHTQGTSSDGKFKGNALERKMYDVSKLIDAVRDPEMPRLVARQLQQQERAYQMKQRTKQVTPPSERSRGAAAAEVDEE